MKEERRNVYCIDYLNFEVVYQSLLVLSTEKCMTHSTKQYYIMLWMKTKWITIIWKVDTYVKNNIFFPGASM